MLRALKKAISETHPLRLTWHRCRAFFAALRYGFPARKLTVIGITGTDGKTTTIGMTCHILQSCNIAAGALSTAFFQVRGAIEWNATQKTSPSPFIIQKFLRRLVREGCTHAVLECSSHGLLQGRMNWIWPRIAAITNLAPEHLDYHGTMTDYGAAKKILFTMVERHPQGAKILNALDVTYDLFKDIPSTSTTLYATTPLQKQTPSDVHILIASDIETTGKSLSATIRRDQDRATYALSLSMIGTFNIENALCALSCSTAVGVPLEEGLRALARYTGVPGRMERIDEGQAFAVIIDFTVTPQSYEKTLLTLRSCLPPGGRLLVLCGSCGDRMREKRPIVGRLVGTYADCAVVSNEDPYTEDPQRIIDDVWEGMRGCSAASHKIQDRREAILFLLDQAKPGDIVLLCGKGSDTTMWVKSGQIPWNERAIVREMLRSRMK